MNHAIGFMIEGLVAFLLLLTIGYCAVLNRRLKRFRTDEHALKATIAELITAPEMAERAVEGLHRTAQECEGALGERLAAAEHCCAELDSQRLASEEVLTRLSRVVAASRGLKDKPAPSTPNPAAVAAAARSFADRLRERVNALAA